MSTAIDLSTPSDGKRHLRLLTNSEIKTFRRCAREHHYAYRLGYRPVERAAPLRFGTLWHSMQERWWIDRDVDAALAVVSGDCDPFDHAMARALMRGYHVRWGDEPIETIAVEEQFRADLVNPDTGAKSRTFQLGGKVDGLVRLRDGVYLTERKSTSQSLEPGGVYWKTLTLDPQISTYVDGVRALGHEVRGVLYDVVRKLGIRPLEANKQRATPEVPEAYEERCIEAIAKEPDRYYARGTIVRLQDEETEARSDRWQVAKGILFAESVGRFPRNVDACMRWNRPCDFFDVCCGTASLDDPTRFRRVEDSHEELQETAT